MSFVVGFEVFSPCSLDGISETCHATCQSVTVVTWFERSRVSPKDEAYGFYLGRVLLDGVAK